MTTEQDRTNSLPSTLEKTDQNWQPSLAWWAFISALLLGIVFIGLRVRW